MPEAHWLTLENERARYDHHDNRPSNQGYVRFLNDVVDVMCGLVSPGARVLDFGSGEHAVLTGLLCDRGRDGVAYDPLYGLGPGAMTERYDAIVLCEVIEHLRELRAELARLAECLRPGGHIVVRTRCYPPIAELPAWWYARDPTHISFFAPPTLAYAAGLCGLSQRATTAPDIFIWSMSG